MNDLDTPWTLEEPTTTTTKQTKHQTHRKRDQICAYSGSNGEALARLDVTSQKVQASNYKTSTGDVTPNTMATVNVVVDYF